MDFIISLEIILIVSAAVVFLLHRLKIPSLVGFLVAGALIGPYGLEVVKDVHAIELMAEIGVVLLLFTIGIEFSMGRLVRMKKAVLGGGSVQALLTIAVSAAGVYLVTEQWGQSLFLGFLITLSSTAIVLKMLAERGEVDTPFGRTMIGILLFQDLCVVPYRLLIPVLAGETAGLIEISLKMGKALLIIAVVLFSARWVMPELLHQVVHTRSRELFITTIIMLCLGIALLTARFGLSLALGAFLAGLIISESPYSHQAFGNIIALRDAFTSFFFISIGMLLDLDFLLRRQPHLDSLSRRNAKDNSPPPCFSDHGQSSRHQQWFSESKDDWGNYGAFLRQCCAPAPTSGQLVLISCPKLTQGAPAPTPPFGPLTSELSL